MDPLIMTPLRTLKEAFDAIPADKDLTEEALGELMADYAIAANKPDIAGISQTVASGMAAFGVTTYGDLHSLTTRAIRRFGATEMQAMRLKSFFGQHMSVEDDESDEEVVINTVKRQGSLPSQAAKQGANTTAISENSQESSDVTVTDGEHEETEMSGKDPEIEKTKVTIGSGERISAFHTLGQGARIAQRAREQAKDLEASGSFAHSGTDSAMLSVAESIQQVATALQDSMEKSAALSSKRETGNKKIKSLKASGQARPTVKVTAGWLRELEDIFHFVEGFSVAVEKFRRNPRGTTRAELQAAVSEMDDLIIYDKIKASMTEVHDAMVDRNVRIERTSAMGLVYDTYLYSLDQDSKLMMEKALYISEQVKPIERHQDIRQLFGAWVDTMCEIRPFGTHNMWTMVCCVIRWQDFCAGSGHSWSRPRESQGTISRWT